MAIVRRFLTVTELQPLTLNAAILRVGDPQGTVIGNILGASPGSTIAFDSLNPVGALQIVGTNIQVGSTPPTAPGVVTFNLVETLLGATNTPRQTNGFSVSVIAGTFPVNTGLPTISGIAQVGQILTASQGTWTNTPTRYTYQWNRGGPTAISGATAVTYVPVAADVGNTLTVSVVAANGTGSSSPVTSVSTPAVSAATPPTMDVIPTNSSVPTISGTARVGQTLTATTGTWTHNPTSFTYQWNRVASVTLYVAITGNDTNPGTIVLPLRTIQEAANRANAGTDIIVRGGTYLGRIWIGNNGMAAAYIRFYPYSGETAIIDGTGTASNTDLVEIDGNYVEFRGFEVRNSTGAGFSVWGGSNDNLINNVIHDNHDSGIAVNGFGTTGFGNNLIQGNTLYNNVLMNSARTLSGGWSPALYVKLNTNTVITGNTVHSNYGEGIDSVQCAGTIISQNTVWDNYSVEIYLDGTSRATVNGNFVYNTGNSNFLLGPNTFPPGTQAVSMGMAIETSGATLANSVITNNIFVGGVFGLYYGNYGASGGIQNSLIANNTFANTTLEVVHIESANHSANAGNNNIFYLSPGHTIATGATTGFTFDHNDWFGGSAGVFSGPGDVLVDPRFTGLGFVPQGYRPTDTSVLTGGVTLPTVVTDYEGKSRTVPYSIGAFQNGP